MATNNGSALAVSQGNSDMDHELKTVRQKIHEDQDLQIKELEESLTQKIDAVSESLNKQIGGISELLDALIQKKIDDDQEVGNEVIDDLFTP